MRKKFIKLYYCRECINKEFNMNLSRENVYIHNYPHACSCCKQVRNIVYKVKFPYNILLYFKMLFH